MTLYDVWDESRGESRESNKDGQIEADSIEEAVEKFCEECDVQGDMGYLNACVDAVIRASEEGSPDVYTFDVCCEAIPTYTAFAKVVKS